MGAGGGWETVFPRLRVHISANGISWYVDILISNQ
jgi:hypothetical protein